MFEQSDLDAYRKIKAPQIMKNRILEQANTTNKKNYAGFAAVAAALFVVVGLSIMIAANRRIPAVSFEGMPASMAAPASLKSIPGTISVPVQIDVKGTPADIDVSEGWISLKEDGIAVDLPLKASKDLSFWWTVDFGKESDEFKLFVNDNTYILKYENGNLEITEN